MYYLRDRPTLNSFFIVDAQTRKIDGAKAIYSFAVIFRYYLVIAGTLATKFRNHATWQSLASQWGDLKPQQNEIGPTKF